VLMQMGAGNGASSLVRASLSQGSGAKALEDMSQSKMPRMQDQMQMQDPALQAHHPRGAERGAAPDYGPSLVVYYNHLVAALGQSLLPPLPDTYTPRVIKSHIPVARQQIVDSVWDYI
jgi:hypothetical protein